MDAINALRNGLPPAAKDMKWNLKTVLTQNALNEAQCWGVAVACAIFSRNAALRDAVLADASRVVPPEVIDDARAAASILAMNTVYVRFRHLMNKDSYHAMRAGVRMNRLAQPATNRAYIELFSLAVSAMAGCQTCLANHEKAALDCGLTEEHVHDAVRIAATMQGMAVSLDMGA
ncbi:MAG: carboxymuconolactone decarboxylase family protein [Myxococcota bacterium]